MKNYYQILSYVFVILITLIIVLNIRFDKNTGLPYCIASIGGKPNPSESEGKINALQRE